MGRQDFLKDFGGRGEKGKIINIDKELKVLKGKVDVSIKKMQNSFVDKKIQIEKTFEGFQKLMGEVRNARNKTSGGNHLELMIESMKGQGISVDDSGSRRARKPAEINQLLG